MSLHIKQSESQKISNQEQAGDMATTTSDSFASLVFVLKDQGKHEAFEERNRQASERREKLGSSPTNSIMVRLVSLSEPQQGFPGR